MIWPRVTKKNPCGICQKSDWCQVGQFGWRCYRVDSPKPFKNGGWFHPFSEKSASAPVKSWKPLPTPPSLKGIAAMIERWALETPIDAFEIVSNSLGVSPDSLASLNMVYAREHRAWAFPMSDGHGEFIGIRLRSDDGRKWAVRGSRGGIFIPNDFTHSGTVYLVEGPTSTAAALSLGLPAIGRPSNNSGGDMILAALKRFGVRRAIIVADNDDKSTGLRPGYDGAVKLAQELCGIRCTIWSPETKDIRDFLKAGGTRQVIEDEIKSLVWRVYT